jgi:hypothetical protein
MRSLSCLRTWCFLLIVIEQTQCGVGGAAETALRTCGGLRFDQAARSKASAMYAESVVERRRRRTRSCYRSIFSCSANLERIVGSTSRNSLIRPCEELGRSQQLCSMSLSEIVGGLMHVFFLYLLFGAVDREEGSAFGLLSGKLPDCMRRFWRSHFCCSKKSCSWSRAVESLIDSKVASGLLCGT